MDLAFASRGGRWFLAACVAALASCGGGGGGGGLPILGGGRIPESSASPVLVHPQLTFTALSSSFAYSCGIATDGRTWCWGRDEYGELGSTAAMSRCVDDTVRCTAAPLPVETSQRFVSVATTWGHGRTCALNATGQAWCWGFGEHGGLGDGSRTSRSTPAPVAGNIEFTTLRTSISSAFACAVAKDETPYCWGGAGNGLMGIGVPSVSYLVPTPVAWGRRFASFDIGELHMCALAEQGEAWCWGSNWYGQLGVGSAGGEGGVASASRPAAVTGGLRFRAIATSSDASCGLTQEALVWCWGAVEGRYTGAPRLIAGLPPLASITGTFAQVCGLTAAGEAWCWPGASGAPERLPGDVRFAHLAQRSYCGLDAAGKAWCWGNNDYRQLGN